MITAISDRFKPSVQQGFRIECHEPDSGALNEDILAVTELFKITESPKIGGLENRT